MLTLPATSTEGTPLKAETAEESAETDVMTQTKLERDQTDMALTKIADTTVTEPKTNMNREVLIAINVKLPSKHPSPEEQDLLSPANVPHQSQCSLPLKTNTADLATALKKSLTMMNIHSVLNMALNTPSLQHPRLSQSLLLYMKQSQNPFTNQSPILYMSQSPKFMRNLLLLPHTSSPP